MITLTKKGAGKAPDYYLKIFEDGTVIYEGFSHVKKLGKVETFVEKSKYKELLAEFKNLKFFDLRDDYSIIDDESHPRTIISISVPIDKSDIKTKTVTYFQKDPTVPNELKQIEKKIHDTVEWEKWDKLKFETKKVEEKKEIIKEEKPPEIKIEKSVEKTIKKKPLDLITLTTIILICIIVVSLIYTGFFNSSDGNNSNGNGSAVITSNESINITKLVSAKEIGGLGEYIEKDLFVQGETVYIYVEYEGFDKYESGDCSLFIELFVKEINGEKSYSDTINEKNANKNEHHWEIKTDGTWNKSAYYIVVYLQDNLSMESVTKTDGFTIG